MAYDGYRAFACLNFLIGFRVVGDAAKGQGQLPHTLSQHDHLDLAGIKFERGGFADDNFFSAFFLNILPDGQDSDIFQDGLARHGWRPLAGDGIRGKGANDIDLVVGQNESARAGGPAIIDTDGKGPSAAGENGGHEARFALDEPIAPNGLARQQTAAGYGAGQILLRIRNGGL
jgi:hypothetical protein